MQLGIKLTGDGDQVLEDLLQRSENLQPALRDLAGILRTRERKVFTTDGAAAGIVWPALSPQTLKRKRGGRVLVDRGLLYRSLTQRSARYAVERVTPDGVLFGTKNPVANLLRSGTSKMPARHPVPPVTAAERKQLTDSLLAYLIKESS